MGERANIKLYNEDCLPAMKKMADNEFDLAIVDPPYRDENQPDQWLRANAGNMKEWEKAPDVSYFMEIDRVSKNQIVWGGNYFTDYLYANNNWIIWHKLNEGVHFSMCEMAWCSIRKNVQLWKRLPDKDKIHPTQKPIQLYKWLLTNYAKDDDKILDTHLGSGSIALACWDLKFDLVGYEIDKDYYDAAVKRLENHKAQMQLF